MTKHRNRFCARLYILFVVLALPLSTAWAEELWQSEPGRERIFNALVDVFEDNYWDPDYRDWRVWAEGFHDQAVSADSRSAFESALHRMVGELADDHSRFVGLEQVSLPSLEEEDETANLGMGFRHSYLPDVGLVVERVFPSTPAAEGGLRRGDVILEVNSESLRTASGVLSTDRLLRDAVASGQVRLSVQRKLDTLTLSITPAVVDFELVADLPYGEMLDETTGYLYLPSFRDEGVAGEVHSLLSDLSELGATSLVLDLRDNLGGRLGELGLVLGAFIEGPWVEAISRDDIVWRSSYQLGEGGGQNVLERADGAPISSDRLSSAVRFTGPVAVLVTRNNSSAGEIAPLVLQELERATIIGEPTLGNVEAIQSFNLPDGSLVYVAIANLQGISGLDYSGGVVPDVTVSTDLRDLSRGFDAPVAEALRSLKALPFTPGKFF